VSVAAEVEVTADAAATVVEFPHRWEILATDRLFVDKRYQRRATSFVKTIAAAFDPLLFQVVIVSERTKGRSKAPYAIIDGQTRWLAAQEVGLPEVPCLILSGLSQADEARVFGDLQTKRRGMASWERFRANVAAGKPEAVQIHALVNEVGFKIMGVDSEESKDPTVIAATVALERTYRIDPTQLERTLVDLKDAWPDVKPGADTIRGLHYFFRHAEDSIDDERLVRRLKVAGPEQLYRRASALREGSGSGGGTSEKYMSAAIDALYRQRAGGGIK